MVLGEASRRRIQWILAVCLAVVLYHLSVFGIFFLVPLIWVRDRLGKGFFWMASVAAAAGIGAGEMALKSLSSTSWTLVDSVVLGFPLVLLAGLAVIDEMTRLGWRFLYRLVAVTAVTGLILFPLTASLLQQDAVVRVLEKSFGEVWKQVFQTPGLDVPGLMGKLNQAEFFDLLKQAFLGSFLLVFFLFWGFTERVSRFFFPERGGKTLKDFFVPPQGAWALLGLWGLILVQGLLSRVGMNGDWGFFEYVVLNLAWVALVIHAAAGWGILKSLMDRWHWPRFGQSAVRIVLLVLFLVPGTGQLVVMGGLPVLAVLELWINFRKRTQGVGL